MSDLPRIPTEAEIAELACVSEVVRGLAFHRDMLLERVRILEKQRSKYMNSLSLDDLEEMYSDIGLLLCERAREKHETRS